MKKMFWNNRKGMSETIGYVLLIIIGIGLSVGVYSYLKLQVYKDQPQCQQNTAIYIENPVCILSGSNQQVTLTLYNSGLHKIDAAYIRLGAVGKKARSWINDPTKVSEGNFYLTNPNTNKKSLQPGERLTLILPKATIPLSTDGRYELEVQPAITSPKGLLSSCNPIRTQKINCNSGVSGVSNSDISFGSNTKSGASSGSRTRRIAGQPFVTLTSPTSSQSFKSPATVSLSAYADDEDGTISKVEFFKGDSTIVSNKIGEDTSSPFEFSWTGVQKGSYVLSAKATDNQASSASSDAVLISVNDPDKISPRFISFISNPPAGSTVNAPASITFMVDVTDDDGSISKVEFFDSSSANPSQPLSTVLTAPYTSTITLSTLGDHSITARATDNDGASTFSTVNILTINEAPVVVQPIPFTITVTNADNSPTDMGSVSVQSGATNIISDCTVTKTGTSSCTTSITAGSVVTITTTAISGGYWLPETSIECSNKGGTFSSSQNGLIEECTLTVSTATIFNTKFSTCTALGTICPNTAPTVTIVSSNGNTFNSPANIQLSAQASDSDGSIAKVEFFNGDSSVSTNKVGTDADPLDGWTFAWTNVPTGSYSLTAKATDNGGASTISSPIPIVVNTPGNTAPTVNLLNPVNNQIFTIPVTIAFSAQASDTDGISKVEFYQGTTKLGEDTSSPYEYSWVNPQAGSYSLTAKAIDIPGSTAMSASNSIEVMLPTNSLPTVTLNSPLTGSQFTTGNTIALIATASDIDGTVTNVFFYEGENSIGQGTKNPSTGKWELAWTNVLAGSYTLTARAVDDRSGSSGLSSSISITVKSTLTISANNNGGSSTIDSGTITTNVGGISCSTPNSPCSTQIPAGSTLTITSTAKSGGYWFIDTSSCDCSTCQRNLISETSQECKITNLNNNLVFSTTFVHCSIWNSCPNIAPTVSITSPSQGASFTSPASITLTTTASDSDGSISKVEFYQGTTKLGEDTSSPYEYSWVNPQVGSYSLIAKAIDNGGSLTESALISITINAPGNNPPTISLTSNPKDSEIISSPASITLTAAASDSDGSISKVEFFDSISADPSSPIATITSSPYIHTFTTLTSGTHIFTAKATDNANTPASTISNQKSVIVNSPPTVSFTSPQIGDIYIAPAFITVSADPRDTDGSISSLQFSYQGGALSGQINPSFSFPPYSTTWSGIAASPDSGIYTLTATASDNIGASVTSTRTTIVTNAPSISMKYPAQGSSYTTEDSVTIRAEANDIGGSINKVEFFDEGTKIGEDTSDIYQISKIFTSTGIHTITATATDNHNQQATSGSVSINVALPTVRLILKAVNTDGSITSNSGSTSSSLSGTTTLYCTAAQTSCYQDYSKGSQVTISATSSSNWRGDTSIDCSNLGGLMSGDSCLITLNSDKTFTTKFINQLPTVSLTSPADGAVFTIPVGSSTTSISLSATASVWEGAVTKVEFYSQPQGGAVAPTLIGTDTTSPFSLSWSNAQAGSYTLTAVATKDNNPSQSTTSSPVYITVNSPANQAPTVGSVSAPSLIINGESNSISTTAADDGTISSVNFYYQQGSGSKSFICSGALSSGSLSSGTWSCPWSSSLISGAYTISATATDNLGSSTISSGTSTTINSRPTITIATPSVVTSGSSVTLTASASDPDGNPITVAFSDSSTSSLSSVSSSGSQFSTTFSSSSSGQHTITATVTDSYGTSAQVSKNLKVNSPPSVSLSTSGSTTTAPATIILTASASDSDGSSDITEVEFYQGSTKIGSDASSPYTLTLNNVVAGAYNFKAQVYDHDSSAESSVVSVIVTSPNQAPTVSLSTAGSTTTAPASIKLTATASDPDGNNQITRVEFFKDGSLINTDSTSPYTYTLSNVIAGTYKFTAKVFDSSLSGTSSEETITVTPNTPPTVSITSPTSGATFTAPASITINTNAQDVNGIDQIDIYQGTTIIGSGSSFTWTGVPAGSYSLTAKATDNLGASTESSPVAITITAPQNPTSLSLTSDKTTYVSGENAKYTATLTDPSNIGVPSAPTLSAGGTFIRDPEDPNNANKWISTSIPLTPGVFNGINAQITDNLGNLRTSNSLNIVVNPKLTVTSSQSGSTTPSGTISVTGLTESCTIGSTCNKDYAPGTPVTVTVTQNENWVASIEGCPVPLSMGETSYTCTFTMNANTNLGVTYSFIPPAPTSYSLSVSIYPGPGVTGYGGITGSSWNGGPGQINCYIPQVNLDYPKCSESVSAGEVVTLALGNFDTGNGGRIECNGEGLANDGDYLCYVTMDKMRTITVSIFK